MKPTQRTSHWIAVACAAALGLLAFEAAGQAEGDMLFAGRPALAGAQAGIGALAGPPQGGIGLQGTDGTQIDLNPPSATRDFVPAACGGAIVSDPRGTVCVPEVLDESVERRATLLNLPDAEQRRGM